MRIAFDATFITGRSGIETYARELIGAIARFVEGTHVVLCTTRGKRDEVRALFPDVENIEVAGNLPHPEMFGAAGAALARAMRTRAWRRVASTVDVVHFPDPLHYVAGLGNAVATVHDVIPLYRESWAASSNAPRQRAMLEVIVRDARRIFVPSAFVREEIARIFAIDASRICVVHEAAAAMFHPVKVDLAILERHGVPRGARFFLCVGRFDPRKNVERVIEAFAASCVERREPPLLVFVGGGSDEAIAQTHAQAARDGVEEFVVIARDVADGDLVHFYNAAIALVFASLAEGFGLPAVEAMQCGCAVIASRASSLPEIVGDAAVLVDPKDVASISTAMHTIATDDAMRARCSAAGRARGTAFSWEKAARATVNGYAV